jgi:hypothetical protein
MCSGMQILVAGRDWMLIVFRSPGVLRGSHCGSGLQRVLTTLSCLAALLGALNPHEVRAEPAPQPIYARDGAYMGGRGIYGVTYFAAETSEANAHVQNGWGFGLNVGYRWRELWAGEVDFEVMDPGYRVNGEVFRNIGMTVYGKAYPLALLPERGDWVDRFQPYVRVGAGFQYYFTKQDDFSAVGFVARVGGGTEFYLTRQLALTLDASYAITTGPISGLNSWAFGLVGLQWRFSPN